ncbi:hypothetical protein CDAR_290341 [Caerostris darwini]|uniref:Uncharacterized protein n=1 Tax=Caerostris darwini TaxID=1538125 RepID=A0AAV4T6A4_9ARAC|nr:hypothetical protein CDAR_290341 [Caerostris darwini]
MALIFPLYQPGHSKTRIDLTLEQCWVNHFTPFPSHGLQNGEAKSRKELCTGCRLHPHPIPTKQQSLAFRNQKFAGRISVLANRISMKLQPQALRRQPGYIPPVSGILNNWIDKWNLPLYLTIREVTEGALCNRCMEEFQFKTIPTLAVLWLSIPSPSYAYRATLLGLPKSGIRKENVCSCQSHFNEIATPGSGKTDGAHLPLKGRAPQSQGF